MIEIILKLSANSGQNGVRNAAERVKKLSRSTSDNKQTEL
jgi:hypothetical protein